jgi:transposase
LFCDRIGQRFDSRRLTVLSCIDDANKYVAPFTFGGNTNADIFLLYSKEVLMPELKKIRTCKLERKQIKPEERLTLILDNASFHKSKEITKLFEENEITLLYLSPYSPDLNPIEKKWAQLKSKIRKYSNFYMFNGIDKKQRIENKIKLVNRLLKIGSAKEY